MECKLFLCLSVILLQNVSTSALSRDSRFLFSSNKDVVSCDFESSGICGYTQDKNDTFDWTRHTGSTVSSNTGPTHDHTYGTRKTGHYMYTEASSPRKHYDTARLTSRSAKTGTSAQSVGFYYQMYGTGMGTLNVYVNRGQAKVTPAFTASGNQGSLWHYGCVNIPAHSTYKIVFEGIIGTNYLSDVAIDDVRLHTSTCPPSTYSPITTASPGGSIYALACTFEQNTCSYTQDKTDKRDWSRHTGNTTSVGTGPNTDHTIHRSTGHYMYFETSSPALPGDKARLLSPTITSSGTVISVKFWYHMYGTDMGTLNVYLKTGSALGKARYHVAGNQGNVWKQGCVEIPTSRRNFQLVFEAVRGKSYHGDIAIDDVTLSYLHCPSTSSHTTAKPSTTTDGNVHVTLDITTPSHVIIGNMTSSVTCTFDDEAMCGYSLVTESSVIQYYWQWTGGQTLNERTGPARDHTSGNGHYMAAVSLGTTSTLGTKADLYSPYFDATARQLKVEFWYNAYSSAGTEFGGFYVYLDSNGHHGTPIYSATKAHPSTSWQKVCVTLPTTMRHVRLLFQAVHGDGVHGDIALDDVTLSTGKCT